MIHLRCPHHGCSIEVADDMLGARIRCPHCEQLLFVEPPNLQSPEPPPSAPPEVPHAVAAGMPPLAAMLGIRAGHGRAWGDAGTARANMTDVDWKALAAFEKVLYAMAALKTAIVMGIAAMLLTVVLWVAAAEVAFWQTNVTPSRPINRIPTLVILCTGFVVMALGRHRLARVQLGTQVTLAIFAALTVAIICGASGVLTLQMLFDTGREPSCPAAVALPLQWFAALCAARACLLTQRAHTAASPHAIRHRLVAALEYLDWIEQEERLQIE